MATFTSGYQIKLIADGGESGTWGQSTNENLERIEQALGESVLIKEDLGPATPMGMERGGQGMLSSSQLFNLMCLSLSISGVIRI